MLNKKEIGNRLRIFISSKFESQAEFARFLGMKPQSLQSYLNGKSIPGGELLSKLMEAGCDINWLLNDSDHTFMETSRPEISYNTNEYKLLGRVPAGRSEFDDWSEYPEYSKLEYDPDTHFFLEVDEEFGYSMMPLINPGDLVLVSADANIKNGDLVAAIYDSTKGALKIYSENVDIPDTVVLTSYNQAIPPLFIKKEKVTLYKIVLIEKRT